MIQKAIIRRNSSTCGVYCRKPATVRPSRSGNTVQSKPKPNIRASEYIAADEEANAPIENPRMSGARDATPTALNPVKISITRSNTGSATATVAEKVSARTTQTAPVPKKSARKVN